jgi:hypothetical protein
MDARCCKIMRNKTENLRLRRNSKRQKIAARRGASSQKGYGCGELGDWIMVRKATGGPVIVNRRGGRIKKAARRYVSRQPVTYGQKNGNNSGGYGFCTERSGRYLGGALNAGISDGEELSKTAKKNKKKENDTLIRLALIVLTVIFMFMCGIMFFINKEKNEGSKIIIMEEQKTPEEYSHEYGYYDD